MNQKQETKGNILIVDDTPENLQVLSATLSDRGYKIRGVVNGKMAIRAARSVAPDLILLDIRMPDMTGYEVCEILKNDRQTNNIPVIFISALDEAIDKVKAFQVGGVDYITKPFQVEEVLARVEHQLTIQKLQKELIEKNKNLESEIIERKKAEQAAEAASQAKSQFLANMSHELRTPLNAILGFTQVMIRDPFLNTEQMESLRIINRSGEHLLELINDVLDLSKIEAGIIDVYDHSFDLYHLLDNLEEVFQFKAERKKLRLKLIIQPDVPQYIKTDEKKLRACLTNLLGNAIKFTVKGEIILRVRLDNQEKSTQNLVNNDSQYLLFEVEDTGVGIAEEEIDKLFDAFVQTEAGRKSAEGTGLGLTITRKFVELMGGEITVNSWLDRGTIFRFNIKFNQADLSEITIQPIQRVIGLEENHENYRILVVDDNKENRLLLLKLLQPIGFDVQEAENGEQAVNIWSQWQPHLIWMDTRMPLMDGLEATRKIRSLETNRNSALPPQKTFSTVIIALTASTFEERRGEIIATGCNDFVRKPFQEHIICDKMQQYLKVKYIYEKISDVNNLYREKKRLFTSEKPDTFFLPLLEKMPKIWVEKVYYAANEVNEEVLAELMSEIPLKHQNLLAAIQELIDDFRLDIIVRITKQFIENN